jgi:hypothetical protein
MTAAMIFSAATEVASESVTLTTYYPAPSGVYTQMITTGNTFLARDVLPAAYWGTGTANESRIGIGTTSPGSKLEVNGDIRMTPANPNFISGGSYITVPNGMYFSGGTTYFQTQAQFRAGIHDDTNANLTIYGGTSGGTTVSGSLTVTGSVAAGGWVPPYTGWASYGTGAGGAAIYNEGATYHTLMIVGNNSANGGAERRVSVWDSLIVNTNGAGSGTISPMDSTCAEVQYSINGYTTCAAAGFGGNSYATVQSGVISEKTIMPYYTNPVGQQQGGLAPMLCCTCPRSGCPL